MKEFTSEECVLQLINSWDHQYQWHWQNSDHHSLVTFQCHSDTFVSVIELRQLALYHLNEAVLSQRSFSWFSTAARFNVYAATFTQSLWDHTQVHNFKEEKRSQCQSEQHVLKTENWQRQEQYFHRRFYEHWNRMQTVESREKDLKLIWSYLMS